MMSAWKGKTLKIRTLIHNAVIYTQSNNQVVNSMAIYKNRIVAVGNNLEHDPDFKSYNKIIDNIFINI